MGGRPSRRLRPSATSGPSESASGAGPVGASYQEGPRRGSDLQGAVVETGDGVHVRAAAGSAVAEQSGGEPHPPGSSVSEAQRWSTIMAGRIGSGATDDRLSDLSDSRLQLRRSGARCPSGEGPSSVQRTFSVTQELSAYGFGLYGLRNLLAGFVNPDAGLATLQFAKPGLAGRSRR